MKLVKQSNFVGIDVKDSKRVHDYLNDLDSDVRNICLFSNGRTRFGSGLDQARGENISGEFHAVGSTGTNDIEFSVSHTIGAVPIGFLVTNINKGGVIYAGSTAWTSTTAYFKCSVASNAAVTIFLLK